MYIYADRDYAFFLIGPSGPPQQFSVSAHDSKTLQLSWHPPRPEDQNGLIRKYMVNITEVETMKEVIHMSTRTTLHVRSLHPFYNYKCSVAAHTIDIGPYTHVVNVQMPEDGK